MHVIKCTSKYGDTVPGPKEPDPYAFYMRYSTDPLYELFTTIKNKEGKDRVCLV